MDVQSVSFNNGLGHSTFLFYQQFLLRLCSLGCSGACIIILSMVKKTDNVTEVLLTNELKVAHLQA